MRCNAPKPHFQAVRLGGSLVVQASKDDFGDRVGTLWADRARENIEAADLEAKYSSEVVDSPATSNTLGALLRNSKREFICKWSAWFRAVFVQRRRHRSVTAHASLFCSSQSSFVLCQRQNQARPRAVGRSLGSDHSLLFIIISFLFCRTRQSAFILPVELSRNGGALQNYFAGHRLGRINVVWHAFPPDTLKRARLMNMPRAAMSVLA